jgi:[NiFe] hydrogenase assembly HybE family chaperone
MADAPSQEETGALLSRKIEAIFGAIERERMDGVPILNTKLSAAAVGMRPHEGAWLCVLVTPWFINVMLLPASETDAAAWAAIPAGTKVQHAFPAGAFEFLCGREEALGPYRMCSLFSPVLQFENQEAALAAAEAAMKTLFEAEKAPEPATKDKPQVSRRSLIFGRKAPAGERE